MTALSTIERAAPEPLPTCIEAEQQVLGAILYANQLYERVSSFLRAEHFADVRHAVIYAKIGEHREKQIPATPVTLKAQCEADGTIAAIGGAAYLAKLVTAVVNLVSAPDYARMVVDFAARRSAIVRLEDGITRLRVGDLSDAASDQLAAVARDLDAIAADGAAPRIVSVGDAASATIAAARDVVENGIVPRIVTTGFGDLDDIIAFKPGRLYILGARPSVGKTAAAQWIAHGAATRRHGVAFFSLEMDADALCGRWLAGMTGVDAQRIDRCQVVSHEIDALERAQKDLASLPIAIETTAQPSVDDIIAGVRKLRRDKVPIELVVVDYMGLLRWPQGAKSIYEAVTRNSAALKAAAKALDVPMLVLAQLNRATESREDKRPGLSDLRDSGSIEQDADAVMFLHREHYYVMRAKPAKKNGERDMEYEGRTADWHAQEAEARGKAELSIAKNRGGRLGYVDLHFHDQTTRFSSLARGRN